MIILKVIEMAEEYTSSIGVNAPSTKATDFDEVYGEQKKAIEKGFNVVDSVGNSLLSNAAEDAAANDVSSGTFKPLPELSPLAKNYNKVGQEMEVSQGRMNIEAANQAIMANIIKQKTESGAPLDQTDINNHNQQMNSYWNGIAGNLSDKSRAQLKMYADYYTNQGMNDIQTKINTQTERIAAYGSLKNMDNLSNNAGQAAARGDYNGAMNFAKQALLLAKDPALIGMIGPDGAAAKEDQLKQKIGQQVGAALGQAQATPGQAEDVIKMLGGASDFNPLHTHAAMSAYQSSTDQVDNMHVVALANVSQMYHGAQDQFKKGIIPDDSTMNQLATSAQQFKKLGNKSDLPAFTLAVNMGNNLVNLTPAQQLQKVVQLRNEGLQEKDDGKVVASSLLGEFLKGAHELRQNDPGLAVMQTPQMKMAMSNYQTNAAVNKVSGVDAPTNVNNFYRTKINTQKSLGYPTALYGNEEAQNMISDITSQPDFATGVQKLRAQVDSLSPDLRQYAKADLLRNKLSPAYMYALGMPVNSGVLNNFNEAMSKEYTKEGRPVTFSEDNWKDLKDKVNKDSGSYVQTLKGGKYAPGSGMEAFNLQEVSAKLASVYVDKQGMSNSAAAKQASQDIFSARYNDPSRGVIVPKPYDSTAVVHNLYQERYKLAQEYLKAKDMTHYNQIITSAPALNSTEDGYVLLNNQMPITKANSSEPISFKLDDLNKKISFINRVKEDITPDNTLDKPVNAKQSFED